MRFLFVNLIAVLLILSAAFVHGRWSHRWNPFDRDAVNAKLEKIPLEFGDWRGQDAPEEDISTWRDEMDLGLIRRYTNQVTGKTVLMMLRGGPPGPIGHHHTPASCYHAVGFMDRGADLTRQFATTSHPSNVFWVSNFEKPGAASTQRARVFWGYTGGNGWVAPKSPRVDLAGYQTCFKMYVIRNLADPDESLDGDVCESFLRDALPEIDSILVPAKAGS